MLTEVYSNAYEVMRSFLAANIAKGVFRPQQHPDDLRRRLNEIIALSLRWNDATVEQMVEDRRRLERFLGHRWVKKEVLLKYIGGWPHVGDIPQEWCQGAVTDVAHVITDHPDFFSKSQERIQAMVPIIDEVLRFFPPILVLGGELRRGSEFLFLPFDIDDGSHRCIAAALAGKESVAAFVGVT